MIHLVRRNQTKRIASKIFWMLAAAVTTFLLYGCSEKEIYSPSSESLTDKSADQSYTFELRQNYPNPFNPTTTIPFSIGKTSHVTLTIYNESGEVVWRKDLGTLEPNIYDNERWDGKDINENRVASGIYIYELVAGDFSASKKMVLLK